MVDVMTFQLHRVLAAAPRNAKVQLAAQYTHPAFRILVLHATEMHAVVREQSSAMVHVLQVHHQSMEQALAVAMHAAAAIQINALVPATVLVRHQCLAILVLHATEMHAEDQEQSSAMVHVLQVHHQSMAQALAVAMHAEAEIQINALVPATVLVRHQCLAILVLHATAMHAVVREQYSVTVHVLHPHLHLQIHAHPLERTAAHGLTDVEEH